MSLIRDAPPLWTLTCIMQTSDNKIRHCGDEVSKIKFPFPERRPKLTDCVTVNDHLMNTPCILYSLKADRKCIFRHF